VVFVPGLQAVQHQIGPEGVHAHTRLRIFSITGCSRMAAMIFSMPGSCRLRVTADGHQEPLIGPRRLTAEVRIAVGGPRRTGV
jgi:hypothetical protein